MNTPCTAQRLSSPPFISYVETREYRPGLDLREGVRVVRLHSAVVTIVTQIEIRAGRAPPPLSDNRVYPAFITSPAGHCKLTVLMTPGADTLGTVLELSALLAAIDCAQYRLFPATFTCDEYPGKSVQPVLAALSPVALIAEIKVNAHGAFPLATCDRVSTPVTNPVVVTEGVGVRLRGVTGRAVVEVCAGEALPAVSNQRCHSAARAAH